MERTDDTTRPLLSPVELLRQVGLFGTMSFEALEDLASFLEERRIATGKVVYEKGSPSEALFIVQSGSLILHEGTERAPGRALARFRRGDFFGESGLLSGESRSETVTAAEPSMLLEFGRAQLQRLLDNQSEVGIKLQLAAARGHAAKVKAALAVAMRQAVRHRIHQDVDLIPDVGPPRRAVLVDLSTLGACLRNVPPAWTEGQDVRFTLGWAGSKLDLVGNIAWRNHDVAGVAFDPSPSLESRLELALGDLLRQFS